MTSSADIRAVVDFVDAIATDADSLPVDQAAELFELLGLLKRSVSTALDAVSTALSSRLEQPQVVDGKRYEVTVVGKWRPQHPAIKRLLVGWALVDRDTGESFDREQAVQRAVDLTYDAFVAPTTMPKKRLLDALGVDTCDVATWEETGTKLVVTDVA
jgi:hypothetical protein